jgi:hypothetical protein
MYKHAQQRPWHLFRHGPLHFFHHFGVEDHAHRREFVPKKDRGRTGVVYASVGLGLVVLALVVLVLFSLKPLIDARRDLNVARGIIGADLSNKALLTTSAGRAQLQTDIGTVSEEAAKASQSLQGSESLRILGLLPVVGTQRNGVIQLSTDVERAAAAGTALLGAVDNLVADSHGTTVSFPALAGLEFYVVEGHKVMATLDRPAAGLLGPIATARKTFDREDAKLLRLLSLSSKTIAFAGPFLGSNGPQTYLIGGENNAEMRDGGAVLSLDVMTTDNGTFSIEHDYSYGDYALSTPANVTLPAGTQKIFGAYLPTEQWPDVDATADFALTGESMQAMWGQATGQMVNGVIGIDVPGVASILKLTGPVDVPGIAEPVSAANIGDVLLNKAYQGLTVNDPQNSRREKLAAVVKAAVDQMKAEHVDLDAFADALSNDVEGRHLMVWSDDTSAESGLLALDAGGTLTTSEPNRTFHVAVENSTADKLDYFVTVGVQMQITVDPSGNALINSTITVANHALPNQPASYQYGPDGVNATTPGQYVARIFFWGPRGSDIPDSTVESGLELAQSHFSLLPRQHNKVTFATVIPHAVVDGRLQLRLIPQARLVPDHLSVQISAPGWNISGATHMRPTWKSTLNLGWNLSR